MVIPTIYMQKDTKWKNIPYAVKGEKSTIGSAGCGVTCMAMVIATWKDKNVTPITTAQWSLAHGYKALNQGTYYTYFVPQGEVYGIDVKRVNTTNIRSMKTIDANKCHLEAIQALKNGDYVIALMGKGLWTSSGHYILLYGLDGSNVLINDPNSTKPERIDAPLSLMQSQVKYYFICKKPNNQLGDEELRYKTYEDVPDWAKTFIKEMIDKKVVTGKSDGTLDLSEDMIRTLYFVNRMVKAGK